MPKTRKKSRTSRAASDGRDPEILRGMARGPWALHWAREEEEKGASFSGADPYELAPEAPEWAERWASNLADKITLANLSLTPRPGLGCLYELAVADGFTKDKEAFGYYLGMQAADTGVRWDDDHRSELTIVVPYDEFYER